MFLRPNKPLITKSILCSNIELDWSIKNVIIPVFDYIAFWLIKRFIYHWQ